MLTLSNQVVRVSSDQHIECDAAPSDSAASVASRDRVFMHPLWMERMGWQCDEPVIVARAAATQAAAGAAADRVQLQCSLCRVSPLDSQQHPLRWSSLDLSAASPTAAAITFRAEVSVAAWAATAAIAFEAQPQAESLHRDTIDAAREIAFAPPPPPAAPLPLGMQTPVKKTVSKLPQPPVSARALHLASPSTPSSSSSLKDTLAASARLAMQIVAQDQPPAQTRPTAVLPRPTTEAATAAASTAAASTASSAAGAIHLLSLRARSAPTKASRVVLQPLRFDASSAALCALPPEGVLDLSALLHRSLQRCYLCPGALVDVRGTGPAELQQVQYLRVLEISPDNEVCLIARGTQLLLQVVAAPAPLLSAAASASAAALSNRSSRNPTPVHPALAALHALLLPPLLYPQAFAHLQVDTPKGLLLSGPPGVGKTYSVSRVCRDLDVQLFLLDGASLFGGGGSVAGAAEEAMRHKFAEARACKKPAVLFIDEIDVLCPARTEGGGLSSRLVAQLLSLMDGLENRGHLIIVGATNHPNSLDAAVRRPGRFDRELRLDPPSVDQRLDILRLHTRAMPLDPQLDLLQVAQQCIGYVGADLAALVREAAMQAMKRFRRAQQQQLEQQQAQLSQPSDSSASSLSSASPVPLVTASDFSSAQLLVPASSLRGNGALSSKSSSSFSDIGGLESVKAQLRQAIEWPLKHAGTFKALGLSTPRGILMHGPPGCAKTSLVRAIAASTSAAFLPLDTAQLYSCFVGEAERILRALFTRARANRPCVLFLDELDAMVHKRSMGGAAAGSGSGSAHSLESRILSTLLNEMDGMQSSQGVLVVAATNRLDMIDDALLRPGRFDNIIYVPPPDAASRLSILLVHSRRMLRDPDSAETVAALTMLASKLEGYSGADLANLCREAALRSIRRSKEGAAGQFADYVDVSDLEAAAAATTPSLNAKVMARYAAVAADVKPAAAPVVPVV